MGAVQAAQKRSWKKTIPLLIAGLAAACSEKPLHAIYPHDQCHRLTLVDGDSGEAVIGAEDITKLPGGDLLVSAYNRRAKTDNGTPPEGGLYIIPATDLDQREIKVSSLFDTMPGGLRPHGLDAVFLKNGFVKVSFVNRSIFNRDGAMVREPKIISFLLKGGKPHAPEVLDGAFCRANDLVLANLSDTMIASQSRVFGNIDQSPLNPHNTLAFQTRQWTTLDRAACDGPLALLENITGFQNGSVIAQPLPFNRGFDAYGGFKSADGLAFPNGIGIQFKDRPLGDNNFLVVAETRANRLRYFPKTDRRDTVALPGSPDNLTVGKPGIVQVAVHPSLFKLALYRYGWSPRAPSRVVKVTGNQVLTLFDDPAGTLYSATSVAVQTAGKLVLGSVGDRGLLVCNGRDLS